MAINAAQKNKILQVVNVFETGSPQGEYGKVVVYADGPVGSDGKRMKQITYGRSQTTEFGVLKILLQQYVDAGGQYAAGISPYLSKIGKQPSLHGDSAFKKLLRDAGTNDPVMAATQDKFFDQLYYQPAYQWFVANKFTLALSLLVIYDSYIHSGSILPFLRERFPERVPKNGGDEQTWIKQYVNVRHNWLAGHPNTILRGTIYRTNCFKAAISKGNWDLSMPVNANGVIIS
jgi:chitosanase